MGSPEFKVISGKNIKIELISNITIIYDVSQFGHLQEDLKFCR